MKLTLEAITIIDAIARKGSFAAAAIELHRVPSTITYAIKKIEGQLGILIFDRSAYRISLTPAGTELLRDGRYILELVAAAECKAKRIATGWEAELRIAVNYAIPMTKLISLMDDFYKIAPDTHLRIQTEVLAGTWDALISDRVDLSIGTSEESPPGESFQVRPLGRIEFLFVVAPHHVLAKELEPISSDVIRKHRVIVAADSSQGLASKTYGLLAGQQMMTVTDPFVKIEAIRNGLGVGNVPKHLIKKDIAEKTLIVKQVENNSNSTRLLTYAWNTKHKGKALNWFETRLAKLNKNLDWFD